MNYYQSNKKPDNFSFDRYTLSFITNFKKITLITFVFAVISIFYSLSLNNIYQSKAIYLLKEDIQYNDKKDISGLVPFNIGSKDSYHMSYIKIVLGSRDFFKILYEDNKFMIFTQAAEGFNTTSNEIALNQSLVNSKSFSWLIDENKKSLKPEFEKAYKKFNNDFSASIDINEGKAELTFQHVSPVYARKALTIINENLNDYIREIKLKGINNRKNFLKNEIQKASNPAIIDSLSQLIQNELEKEVFYSTSDNIFFDVIDNASMGIRVQPKRALIVIYLTFLGFIFSTVFFLIKEFLNIAKD